MSTSELAWFKSSYSSSGSGDCVEVALNWLKSSYSSSGDGDCIEVALNWRKSTYSSGSGDDCVEVAVCPATIHVRDSKAKEGPQLALSPTAWSAFVTYAGE
ncbi:DUF397 domain-containing protein [Streptomyces roseochromogenus]|uniref:DUF397 domain-containing protein n=1 Tax=Streptomyces roseochromogenus subsp. oscitans DS 12.976 TaxID=1352936 RepID=V6JWE6_STRRC|nr:DUF397 domain-containing protein [Streptomyces roseochromogenus]EST24058.1 hypothetical protein M878_31790 [Streptomyces roseochromogenus subsp. oscitans DS 12.976]